MLRDALLSGQVIPEEVLKEANEGQKLLKNIIGAIEELGAEIGSRFTPILREMDDELKTWKENNKEIIRLDIDKTFKE